jgi:deoxycytidine triphosphate deaminase
MRGNLTRSVCGEAELVLETHDPCSALGHEEVVTLPPDCSAFCTARSNILRLQFLVLE